MVKKRELTMPLFFFALRKKKVSSHNAAQDQTSLKLEKKKTLMNIFKYIT